MSVTQKEIVAELLFLSKAAGFEANEIADIIEREGIAPPEGYAIVPIKIPDYEELYFDLIMQVARKFPDETRHDTAKRYIIETETILLTEPSAAKEPS